MPKRVLLVDDDAQFRGLVSPLLRERGFDVIEAAKTTTASVALSMHLPHVIVVDGLLPDRLGMDWIAELRATGVGLPIVFVSAFWRDLASYKRLTQELDVALVFYKPVVPERFAAHIAELAEGRSPSTVGGSSPATARVPISSTPPAAAPEAGSNVAAPRVDRVNELPPPSNPVTSHAATSHAATSSPSSSSPSSSSPAPAELHSTAPLGPPDAPMVMSSRPGDARTARGAAAPSTLATGHDGVVSSLQRAGATVAGGLDDMGVAVKERVEVDASSGRRAPALSRAIVATPEELAASNVPAELSTRFRQHLPDLLHELLSAATRALANDHDTDALDRVRALSHELRGTAGAFGFDEVGRAAGAVEDLVYDDVAGLDADGFWDLTRAAPNRDIASETSTALPSRPPLAVGELRVLGVDGDPSFVRLLDEVAELEFGVVRAARTPEEALSVLAAEGMDVALVSSPLGEPDRALELVRTLTRSSRIPVAYVSMVDTPEMRLNALRFGAALFLAQPLDHDTLALALRQLRALARPPATSALVVGRDAARGEALVDALDARGLEAAWVSAFGPALRALERDPVDLVFVDDLGAELPAIDLIRVLRASPRFHDAVLVVVGAPNAEARLAAITEGADEAILRGEPAEHALALALAAARRARRFDVRVDVDRGTGLARPPLFMASLAARLSDARRERQPLTVAVLALDRMRALGQRPGGVEEAVRAVSTLLRGRFRATDLRARLGRDLFAMAFFGTSAAKVGPVLARAQSELAALPLEVGRVEFSAGLATFPDAGESPHELLDVALERLRRARSRAEGRSILG